MSEHDASSYIRSPKNLVADLNAAVSAVQARSADLSRDEVRQHLVSELRSRSILLPPPVVDRLCDDVSAKAHHHGRLLHSAKRSFEGAKFARTLIRSISAIAQHRPLPDWDVSGMRILTPIAQVRPEVMLLDSAQEVISIGTENLVEIWFGQISEGSSAVPNNIEVFRGDERIGILDSVGSQHYGEAVRRAYGDDLIPVIDGIREKQGNGKWRLFVGFPFLFPSVK
jgi:hypothetical protein